MADPHPPWTNHWSAADPHAPEKCPTCGPIMASSAYKRGTANARANRAKFVTESMELE